MTSKRISYYSETQGPTTITTADQLIIEVGRQHVACMVKSAVSNQVESFELFQPDHQDKDWAAIFIEISAFSQLINKSYSNTHIYYNFPEALIIPESKFTMASGKAYLDQVYGENNRDPFAYETFSSNVSMVCVFRVNKILGDTMRQRFPTHRSSHVYTAFLNSVFARALPQDSFTSIRFYSGHFIVAVFKDKKLQLIQSFHFETDEDILYNLLNIIRQFELNPDYSVVEISGELDKSSPMAQQLPDLFGKINWDNCGEEGIFKTILGKQPAHFFTPYYKLVV